MHYVPHKYRPVFHWYHLKNVVPHFLTMGVVECNSAHRRYVRVLYMLHKITIGVTRCTLFMVPYVTARVTRGALVIQRYTYVPPSWITSQYRRIFIPLSVSPWNVLGDPSSFYGVLRGGF